MFAWVFPCRSGEINSGRTFRLNAAKNYSKSSLSLQAARCKHFRPATQDLASCSSRGMVFEPS
jgi:hypothetical protein